MQQTIKKSLVMNGLAGVDGFKIFIQVAVFPTPEHGHSLLIMKM